MAAIGADYRLRQLGVEAVLFDAAGSPGGHTTTHTYEGGWVFDEGPHVSFTKIDWIRDLLGEAVEGDFQTVPANVDNYWRGHRFKHPAICNLYGLPEDLLVSCIRDFVAANAVPAEDITNYEQWLLASYGRTFAETFPMEYAKKVHTTTADRLGIDWLGPRLYRADLDEVLRGALSSSTPNVHYVTEYRYPTRGGFFAYLKPFLAEANLRSSHRLVSVDPEEKTLHFANDVVVGYDHLISSIPLPEFVQMIDGVPEEVTSAARQLTATEMVLVNVGVDREGVGDTWTYFYDQNIVFTRVSYPGELSPNMVPDGCGSFQAEIYFSEKYLPRSGTPESFIDQTISDLRKCGLILDSDSVLHTSAIRVPYGNIIHDHDKLPSLDVIHPYLQELGIKMCGRYGLWGYQWTDEAFLSGDVAAQSVLDEL